MRQAGFSGTTVSIKVRFADFATITRSHKRKVPTDSSREIFHEARSLFLALHLDRARIRLVGVRVEGILDRRRWSPNSSSGLPIVGGGRRRKPSTRCRPGSAGQCPPGPPASGPRRGRRPAAPGTTTWDRRFGRAVDRVTKWLWVTCRFGFPIRPTLPILCCVSCVPDAQ